MVFLAVKPSPPRGAARARARARCPRRRARDRAAAALRPTAAASARSLVLAARGSRRRGRSGRCGRAGRARGDRRGRRGIGVGVGERDRDDGARAASSARGIARAGDCVGEVAHLAGVAAGEPVAVDGVARRRGADRGEADAGEAERQRLGAEERGGGGGIERGGCAVGSTPAWLAQEAPRSRCRDFVTPPPPPPPPPPLRWNSAALRRL